MDELLPRAMLEALQMCSVVFGIMVMEVIIIQWMLILVVILIVLFYFSTKIYLKTAQNVKRLEGVSKYWNELLLVPTRHHNRGDTRGASP